MALGLPFSVETGTAKVAHPAGPAATPDATAVVTDVAPVAETAAPEPIASESLESAPVAAVATAEPPPPPDPCSGALAWVAEEAGLPLPPGVGYHCPSSQFAHRGAACRNASPCRGSAFIAINMDLMAGTNTAYLRHVVAHEICHILDWQTTGTTSEARADACAAAHGAPA